MGCAQLLSSLALAKNKSRKKLYSKSSDCKCTYSTPSWVRRCPVVEPNHEPPSPELCQTVRCQTFPFLSVPGISSCLSPGFATPHTSPNISPWEYNACPVPHA